MYLQEMTTSNNVQEGAVKHAGSSYEDSLLFVSHSPITSNAQELENKSANTTALKEEDFIPHARPQQIKDDCNHLLLVGNKNLTRNVPPPTLPTNGTPTNESREHLVQAFLPDEAIDYEVSLLTTSHLPSCKDESNNLSNKRKQTDLQGNTTPTLTNRTKQQTSSKPSSPRKIWDIIEKGDGYNSNSPPFLLPLDLPAKKRPKTIKTATSFAAKNALSKKAQTQKDLHKADESRKRGQGPIKSQDSGVADTSHVQHYAPLSDNTKTGTTSAKGQHQKYDSVTTGEHRPTTSKNTASSVPPSVLTPSQSRSNANYFAPQEVDMTRISSSAQDQKANTTDHGMDPHSYGHHLNQYHQVAAPKSQGAYVPISNDNVPNHQQQHHQHQPQQSYPYVYYTGGWPSAGMNVLPPPPPPLLPPPTTTIQQQNGMDFSGQNPPSIMVASHQQPQDPCANSGVMFVPYQEDDASSNNHAYFPATVGVNPWPQPPTLPKPVYDTIPRNGSVPPQMTDTMYTIISPQAEQHQPGVVGQPDHHFSGRQVIPLSTRDDDKWLSELLCYVRSECAEIFTASQEDVASRMNSKKVSEGQVGIRCRFCKHLPHRERTGRSSSYPSSISRIYQSITMMLRDHFTKCSAMPPSVKERYMTLKANASQGATDSRKYWISSAHSVGLVDTEGSGIRFATPAFFGSPHLVTPPPPPHCY